MQMNLCKCIIQEYLKKEDKGNLSIAKDPVDKVKKAVIKPRENSFNIFNRKRKTSRIYEEYLWIDKK